MTQTNVQNYELVAAFGDAGLDVDAALSAYEDADASRDTLFNDGDWGHVAFFGAVRDFVGVDGSVDVMETSLDDTQERFAVVDKNECNTVERDGECHVAVTSFAIETPEQAGRFLALVDGVDSVIEWGFTDPTHGADLTVVVAPSDSFLTRLPGEVTWRTMDKHGRVKGINDDNGTVTVDYGEITRAVDIARFREFFVRA